MRRRTRSSAGWTRARKENGGRTRAHKENGGRTRARKENGGRMRARKENGGRMPRPCFRCGFGLSWSEDRTDSDGKLKKCVLAKKRVAVPKRGGRSFHIVIFLRHRGQRWPRYSLTAVFNAISIIWRNPVCRPSADSSSSRKMWSDIVKIVSACFFASAALI